ncbi:hypothetical protein QYE76_033333 [Lolium multiflorum]|uniref:Uncharacterized protein n=1 Tax=Lolium multiflorum TaxID=4521 RepID=A0AAD8QV33_LOLMU|nr:hypothetical protein QYE76_033333 [Lolium multiflorum]
MRRFSATGARQQQQQGDAMSDRLHRYRGVLMVLLSPLLLVSFVLLMMPRSPAYATAGGASGVLVAAGGRRWGPIVRFGKVEVLVAACTATAGCSYLTPGAPATHRPRPSAHHAAQPSTTTRRRCSSTVPCIGDFFIILLFSY